MLNKLSKEINEANKKKGFYEDAETIINVVLHTVGYEMGKKAEELFDAQRIALIHSEVSEALEASRKGRKAKLSSLDKERMANLEGEEFKEAFEELVKGTEEEEIADSLIRLLDYVGYKRTDIEFFIEQKLKYNKLRPYKHSKNY